jgi:hypothetical protein
MLLDSMLRDHDPARRDLVFLPVGLRALSLRHLVEEREGGVAPGAAEVPLLQYHANSVRHLLPEEV